MKAVSRIIRIGVAVAALVAVGYGLVRWHVRASAPETLAEAEEYLRQRENLSARETLEWLLWFTPAQDRALLITGISLNADQEFQAAINILEQIPKDSESAQEGGIALASSLTFDGQLERAESVLEGQIARFPHSVDAYERLVRLYLSELRVRDATELLLDRWHRRPDDLSVLPDLLELEANVVTPHNRVDDLEAADQRHPDQASVVLALARAYSLMGMMEQSKNRFQAALELSPNDPKVRILAAGFSLDSGESGTAASLLGLDAASTAGDAVADAFKDDRYWFLRCRIAERSGETADAYAHLQQAIALRPNEETYVLLQAALLRRMGRVDEATQTAIEATQLAEDRKQLFVLSDQLDRDRPDSQNCLAIADLLERLGHPGQAVDWRRVSTAVAPSEAVNMFPPPPRVRNDTVEDISP